MELSLIIPYFNEEQNLPSFLRAATTALDDLNIDYELLFFDDGSTDKSTKALMEATEAYSTSASGRSTIRIVELSRNFGKEAALLAGLERARGDYVGFIDSDMQQDPCVACEMYEYLRDNPDIDCVAAVPKQRKESLPLRLCKKAFYRGFNAMGETHILTDVSDFRVFRRNVAEALVSMQEQFRFSKGLFAWIGFRTHVIPYEVRARYSGTSRWTLRKLISYGWNGVLAFSTWPLKLVMYAGIILALISLVFFGLDLFEKAVYNIDIPLSQILIYVVLLMGGIQMFVLGLFGEYMARAYIETKRRPVYLVREDRTMISQAKTGCSETLQTEAGCGRASQAAPPQVRSGHAAATQANIQKD